MEKQKYGLFTTVTMILGTVIGSGIYFKSDDILTFTGGNVWLGVLVLVIGSSCIIFGSLSLSELAQRSMNSGGISGYFEKFIHPALGAAIGIIQSYVALPTIVAIVCWVAAIYTFMLVGKDATFEMQIALGTFYLLALSVISVFARKIGGYFQSMSTLVKVIPLIIIAVIGIFWTGTQPTIPTHYTTVPIHDVGWGWLSALVPLAFAYDGWFIVLNITPEIKNPQKNLIRALFMGPLMILLTYVAYFYGLTRILGESFIMSTGNEAVHYAIQMLFGETIARLLMVVVIIAVLGVANGVLLGGVCLPQALVERGWIRHKFMSKVHPKYQIPVISRCSFVVACLFWLFMHYFTQVTHILQGTDVSEVAVVFTNLSLGVLYLTVLRLYFKGEVNNKLTGLISPILATIGALIIFIGSLIMSPIYTSCFVGLGIVFCAFTFFTYRNNS